MARAVLVERRSVPGTCAEDGDPLDVLVLMSAPAFAGCLVTTHLIGGIAARQKERGRWIRNDRLIGVPGTSVNDPPLRTLRQLPATRLTEIEQFFTTYNHLQDREFKVMGRFGPAPARRLLAQAIRRYASRGT